MPWRLLVVTFWLYNWRKVSARYLFLHTKKVKWWDICQLHLKKKEAFLTCSESCLMLCNNLAISSICSPNCHSFAYFLTFESIVRSLCRAASPDWHFWWAMGGFHCCKTDSFWQLSTSGHVQSLRPTEGRHQYRRRRRWNVRFSFVVLLQLTLSFI